MESNVYVFKYFYRTAVANHHANMSDSDKKIHASSFVEIETKVRFIECAITSIHNFDALCYMQGAYVSIEAMSSDTDSILLKDSSYVW